MPNIYYLILFSNSQIQALLNLNNEINKINPVFANKLSCFKQNIDIGA